MQIYKKISIPNGMLIFSDSDRISHRFAMPFPDSRHGIAFGAANICARFAPTKFFAMYALQKQAFDGIHNKKTSRICEMFAAECSALVTPTGFKPVTF